MITLLMLCLWFMASSSNFSSPMHSFSVHQCQRLGFTVLTAIADGASPNRQSNFMALAIRCQVNIGIPKYRHPRCLYSRKNRHPDAYIYVNVGIRVPIFTVNMGILL